MTGFWLQRLLMAGFFVMAGCYRPAIAAEIPWIDTTFSQADLAAEREIEAVMDRSADAPFGRISIRDVVAYLQEQGINVMSDARAFEDLGIDADSTRVAWVQSSVSLRASLEMTLEPVELTSIVRHGLLLITTREKAQMSLRTRLYDVTSVVARVRQSAPEHYQRRPGNVDFDEMIEQIVTSVEPDSWEDLGGLGTVVGVERNGRAILSVSTTDAIHRQVTRYLSGLRRISGVGTGSAVRTMPTSPRSGLPRAGRPRSRRVDLGR